MPHWTGGLWDNLLCREPGMFQWHMFCFLSLWLDRLRDKLLFRESGVREWYMC
jgi:hypothetical protein